MHKKENAPFWVLFAFSSIQTRVGATRLIWACVIFTIYCIPWPAFFSTQELWLNKILIEDWSWFSMMLPIIFWYWMCLKWMDNNSAWESNDE